MITRFSGRTLATVVLLLCTAPSLIHGQDASAIAASALPSVVSIKTYNTAGEITGAGSGFILRDGRIATAAHVVAGAAWAEVLDSDGKFLGSVPFAESVSSRADLVILPSLEGGGRGLVLAQELPSVGSRVVVIGSPMGLENTVSDGLVSGIRELDDVTVIQLSAPISGGSSGGPVLGASGEVVGVAFSYLSEGQNLNFAIPVDELAALARSPAGRVALSGISGDAHGQDVALPERSSAMDRERLFEALPEFSIPGFAIDSLTHDDFESEGRYYDGFWFEASAGETFTLTMSSDAIDAFLRVAKPVQLPSGEWESEHSWEDDDGGTGLDARITLTVPSDGRYVVFPSSYGDGELGSYVLAVTQGQPPTESAESRDDRWIYATSSSDLDAYIDVESVSRLANGNVEAWFRMEYDEPYTDDYGDTYDEEVKLFEFDCDRRRMRVLELAQYLRGSLVWSRPTGDPSEWGHVVPGTLGEGYLEAACTRADGQ